MTEADASTHLVVLRFGKYYGFRALAGDENYCSSRYRRISARRAPSDFYSFNFGVCEQWELVAIDHAPVPCGGRAMRRNRRFERVELDVAVALRDADCAPPGFFRVQHGRLYDDDIAYVEYGSANDAPPEVVSPERVVKSAPLAAPPSPVAMEAKMEKTARRFSLMTKNENENETARQTGGIRAGTRVDDGGGEMAFVQGGGIGATGRGARCLGVARRVEDGGDEGDASGGAPQSLNPSICRRWRR